jgi:hypothetical protein
MAAIAIVYGRRSAMRTKPIIAERFQSKGTAFDYHPSMFSIHLNIRKFSRRSARAVCCAADRRAEHRESYEKFMPPCSRC